MGTSREGPEVYRIRVRGWIDARWGDWLDGMTVSSPGGPGSPAAGETVLTGAVVDQAALLGLLQKLHNMGLSILDLRIEGGAPPQAASSAAEEEG